MLSLPIFKKKQWSLKFDKDSNRSQREKILVYSERKYQSWGLLPYVVVVSVRIFR